MKEQIRIYLEGAFASLPQTTAAQELKEELCQNLCDKYDDLVAGGASERAAFAEVIDSIGDVSELMEAIRETAPALHLTPSPAGEAEEPDTTRPPQDDAPRYDTDDERDIRVAGDFSEIAVDWLSGEIHLYPHDEDYVRVVETPGVVPARERCFLLRQNGGRLTISDRRKRFFFGFGWVLGLGRVSLDIYLPHKDYAELKLDNISGSIVGEGLCAQELNAETMSGRIDISGSFERCKASAVSGSVAIQGEAGSCRAHTISGSVSLCGNMPQSDVETTSGSIDIELNTPPLSLKTSCVSGKTRLALPENDGFTLRLSKVSGRFESEFALCETGGSKIYKDGCIPLSVQIVSGLCSLVRI